MIPYVPHPNFQLYRGNSQVPVVAPTGLPSANTPLSVPKIIFWHIRQSWCSVPRHEDKTYKKLNSCRCSLNADLHEQTNESSEIFNEHLCRLLGYVLHVNLFLFVFVFFFFRFSLSVAVTHACGMHGWVWAADWFIAHKLAPLIAVECVGGE